LAVKNFLATNENHGAQQEFSVSIKISKEIVPFHQAPLRIPNLGVQYRKWFNWTSKVE